MTFAENYQRQRNEVHLTHGRDSEIILATGQYLVVRHESGFAPNILSVRYHGPYRIIEVNIMPQGTVYTCYSPKDGKVRDFHTSVVQRHPCQSDQEAVQSAIKDDDRTFIVESILGHEIIKDELNLNIKWHGYAKPE